MNSDGSDQNLLVIFKEWAPLVALAVRWGAVVVGGMSLLLYAGEIGHFPAGIGLGEGLAFYLICTAFFILYVIYWASLTSIGALLMRLPFELLVRWDRKRGAGTAKPRAIPHSVPLFHMSKLEVWVTAAIGLWVLVKLSIDGSPRWYWLLGVAVVQGLIVGLWIVIRRQQEFAETTIGGTGSESPQRDRERRFTLRAISALIIFMPFIVMPDRQGFVDTTFSWAQLRKERAVVHIKAPWSRLLDESRLGGQESFRGPDYKRYAGVTVLLRSLGDSVVIAIPTGLPDPATTKLGTVVIVEPDQMRKLAIPASDIWVE